MAVNVDDPTIPALCTDSTIESNVAAAECYAPKLNFGPIRNLYYARPGHPFTAVPTTVEITRRLALPDTDAEQLVGPIVCEVSRAAATGQGNTVRVNGVDYDTTTTSLYDVNFQDTNQANHDMMRKTQAGAVKGHWYGVDQNNLWRGGQNGMTGGNATLKLREVLPTDENGLQTFTGQLTGAGKYDDARMESPIPVVFAGR